MPGQRARTRINVYDAAESDERRERKNHGGIQVRDSRIKDGRDFGNAGLYAANNQCILVCSLGLHGRLHRDKCNAGNLLTSFTYRVSEKLMEVAPDLEHRSASSREEIDDSQ